MKTGVQQLFTPLAVSILLTLLIPGSGAATAVGDRLLAEGEKAYQDFDFTVAEKKFKEALKSYEDTKDLAGTLKATERLGILLSDLGNYAAAAETYSKASGLCDQLRDSQAKARILTALGLTYDDWGDFAAATYYYQQALQNRPKDVDLALLEINLADMFLRLGDLEESTRHLKASEQATRKTSDAKQLGALLLQLGGVYQRLGHFDEARALYLGAQEVTREPRVTRLALTYQGDLSFLQNDQTQAETLYRKAGDSIGLGRVLLSQRQFDPAARHFQEALKEAEHHRQADGVFAARSGLGLVHMEQAQYPQAEAHLSKAVEALEEMHDLLPVGKKVYFLSETTHGFSHIAAYDALVLSLATQGKKEDAFKIAEHTRSRALIEALSGKLAIVGVPEGSSSPQHAEQPQTSISSEVSSRSPDVEIMPFARLGQYFGAQDPSYHDSAMCALMVRATLQDFDKSEAAEAKAEALLSRAGFDPRAKGQVKVMAEKLKQEKVHNHLTSIAGIESGGK